MENVQEKLELIQRSVFSKEGKIFTDSLTVSEVFDKQHAHILRDIDQLINSLDEKGQSNFGESSYINSQNKTQRKFLLTKKALTLLAMGFTGEKALKFKLAYIDQFEAMEQMLLNPPTPKTPQNSMQLLETFFGALKETNQRIDNIPNLIEEKVNSKLSELKENSFKKLNTFPKPLVQVSMFLDPTIDQAETDRLVKEWSTTKGLHPQVVYRALYKVFQAVKKINLYKLAENSGTNKLSYICENGLLPDFYSFVHQHLIEHDGKFLNQDNIEMA